jgi:dTDP-4-amino-4,6-dideoxygalactose transaminase
MGSNYRLSEFQGAVLNSQFDRFDAQATTRDRNGAYLAARLAEIPGLHPQPRRFAGTRHAYHLFAMRYEPAVFGVPRQVFLDALKAEGVPAVAGYIIPLYAQPLSTQKNFGPYTGYWNSRPDLDYAGMICPNCERICREEGLWLTQNMLLGTQQDMDQIAAAFSKLHDRRADLKVFARQKQVAAK